MSVEDIGFVLAMTSQEPTHKHGGSQRGQQLRAVAFADSANQTFNRLVCGTSRRALQAREKLVHGRIVHTW